MSIFLNIPCPFGAGNYHLAECLLYARLLAQAIGTLFPLIVSSVECLILSALYRLGT